MAKQPAWIPIPGINTGDGCWMALVISSCWPRDMGRTLCYSEPCLVIYSRAKVGQAQCPRALSAWGGVTLEGLSACPFCSCNTTQGWPRDSSPAVAEFFGKAELFQGGFKTLCIPHPATDLPGNAILLLHTVCLLDQHPVLCPPHPRRK